MIYENLIESSILFKKQLERQYSLNECQEIGIKSSYTVEEFGKFETLCSRYSRSIDFLIRKLFRSIDAYEFENQGTLIDIVNNAHKRGLFDSVDELRLMKDVRNSIVHEYIEDDLMDIFEEVIRYSHKLITIGNNTLQYIERIRDDE